MIYILGRLSDRTYRTEAHKELSNYLTKMNEEKRLQSIGMTHNVMDNVAREWLLLERTIYISLIYLGDEHAADNYLETMLQQPACDDLNRGFHLEYYEDAPRPPTAQEMLAFDDVIIAPEKTFEILLEKLRDDIGRGEPRRMSSIELYTLCSLCVNRHVVGHLGEHKRGRLHSFLEEAERVNYFGFPTSRLSYIEMAKDILRREEVSVGEIVGELHWLKRQKRAGWNAVHVIDGKINHRRCPNPESVSDHTWGCILLADAFLPEQIPSDGYSKYEVIRMLLIHDLAEAYTGDKPSFSKTYEDIAMEDRIMRRTMALATIKSFPGIISWQRSWEDLRRLSSINAQIATDIDLLENYLQMLTYYHEKDCEIPDAEIWGKETFSKLRTQIVRDIFRGLRHERAPFLEWYRK